jgi:phage-related protein
MGAGNKAFDTLGVSIKDANGNLRDSEAVFADTINALGGIQNEAERDALSMEIFGKSAQELNPLIKAGSAELARLSEEAHKVGAVMSEEDVAAFESFDDTLASLQAGLKGTLGTLAGAFLPGFQAIMSQAGGYLAQFSEIVRSSDGDIGQIAQGVGGLVSTIVSDIAGQAPQLLQTGVTILQSIIQSILGALPTLIPAAVNIILTLVQFLISNLPMLIDAGLKAIIALANGIGIALPTLIPAIIQALITIVNTLLANMPMLIDAALQLIMGLAQGLIIALPILIAALPQIIQAILNALIQALPLIYSMAGQLIGMLATGLLAAIPVLLGAVAELIVRLGVTLGEWIKTMPEMGKALLNGIWKGIQDNAGAFFGNIKSFFSNMVGNIKSLLGIRSPSTVMADEVGAFLPAGIGQGFDKQLPTLHKHLAQSMLGLTNNMRMSIPDASGAPATGVSTATGGVSVGNITISVDARGATDPKAVGDAVSDSVLRKLRSLGGA